MVTAEEMICFKVKLLNTKELTKDELLLRLAVDMWFAVDMVHMPYGEAYRNKLRDSIGETVLELGMSITGVECENKID